MDKRAQVIDAADGENAINACSFLCRFSSLFIRLCISLPQRKFRRQMSTGRVPGDDEGQLLPCIAPAVGFDQGGTELLKQLGQRDAGAERVVGKHHMQATRNEGRGQPAEK